MTALSEKVKPIILSKPELDYLYNLGVKNFKIKNYNVALSIFELISSIDLKNVLYVKALAACMHANKEFMLAICIYRYAYILSQDSSNVDCFFYSGVCYYELKQYEKAKTEFQHYLSSTLSEQQPNIKKQAELYLVTIDQSNALKESA